MENESEMVNFLMNDNRTTQDPDGVCSQSGLAGGTLFYIRTSNVKILRIRMGI